MSGSEAGKSVSWQRWAIPMTLVLVIVSLLAWYYHDIITWFPSHIHAWTQSDRLALAYCYLDNGLNFFLPCTYNVFTPDGITAVDFPIHEYIVALIMKGTGVQEPVVFRLYTLVYSCIGYCFLYLLGLKYSRSHFRAAVLVLFAFTCPIITYYQAGFIPSATSLASCYIGFYFYLGFKESKRYFHLFMGVGFLTLAALPRLSVNVVLFAVVLTEAVEWYVRKKVDRNMAITFASAYALLGLALLYKTYLNITYGSRFLTRLLPADDASDLVGVSSSVWERWSMQFMTIYHWMVFGVALMAIAVAAQRGRLQSRDKHVLVLGGWITAGTAAFYLALTKQFIDHEYYFMDSLYQGVVLVLMTGLAYLPMRTYVQKMIWPAFLVGALIGMASGSHRVQKIKYADQPWDRGEVTRQNFTGAEAFLDKLGIPGEAKILVYEAHSTNVPLLLMNRKGYTVLNSTEENIRRALDLDFDFIVIQDDYIASDVISNAPWVTDCLERLGGNGRISAFTIRRDCETVGAVANSITEVLGFDSLLLDIGGTPGEGAGSRQSKVLLNMEKPVGPGVEYGPTVVLGRDVLNGAEDLLVRVQYWIDSSTTLPIRYTIALSAEYPGDSIKYTSHPVKIPKAGEGTYYCTFDLTEYNDAMDGVRAYIWNRFSHKTGIEHISFSVYAN